MGIAPVEPQESERFKEGNYSDFQDGEESTTRETETQKRTITETLGSGEFHEGYVSASLRECVEIALQHDTVTPATLHSGEGSRRNDQPATGYEPKCGTEPVSGGNLCEATTTRRCVTPSHKKGKEGGRCDTQVRTIASWSQGGPERTGF